MTEMCLCPEVIFEETERKVLTHHYKKPCFCFKLHLSSLHSKEIRKGLYSKSNGNLNLVSDDFSQNLCQIYLEINQ